MLVLCQGCIEVLSIKPLKIYQLKIISLHVNHISLFDDFSQSKKEPA